MESIKAALKRIKHTFKLFDTNITVEPTYYDKGDGSNQFVSEKESTKAINALTHLKPGLYLITSYPSWDVAHTFFYRFLLSKKKIIKEKRIKVLIMTVADFIAYKRKVGDAWHSEKTQEDKEWEVSKLKAKYRADIFWMLGLNEGKVEEVKWYRDVFYEIEEWDKRFAPVTVITGSVQFPYEFAHAYYGRAEYIINFHRQVESKTRYQKDSKKEVI